MNCSFISIVLPFDLDIDEQGKLCRPRGEPRDGQAVRHNFVVGGEHEARDAVACGHRSARKADKEAAQAVGLYAPPPGGHGVLDHRQTNRVGEEYCEETLWGGSGDAGESVNDKGKYCPARND